MFRSGRSTWCCCGRCGHSAPPGWRTRNMTDEKAPTPEEQREAEALARALDGQPADAPPDALEAAALLRGSRDAELSDARARAVRERVLPRLRHWHWLAPLGTLAA